VDAAGDQQHELALPENLVALALRRRAALEVQLLFELLIAIEVLERIGRADFERDERVVVARLAKLTLLSAPTLKPRNCSGVCRVPAAVATRVEARTSTPIRGRRLTMKPPGRATIIFGDIDL
jgi:hypothetical protein